MSRAVRFEDTIPQTPDEFASPHHNKAFFPKGILKGLKNGKASSSRRDRRYSTPVEELAKMQNLSVAPSDAQHRQDYRSRRRSISGNPTHDHQRPSSHQYDTLGVPRASSSTSRRESPAGHHSRPLLSPRHASQTIGSSSRHSYNPYATATSSSKHNGRWYEGDTLEVPGYGQSHPSTSLSTGYPAGPGPMSTHPAFMYGSSTATRSSTAYLTPDLVPNRALPPSQGDSARPRHSQSSVQDVVVHRHLKHPDIVWNLAFPFSSAIIDSRSKLHLSELDSLATSPAIDKLTIKFDSYSRAQQALRSLFRAIKVRGSQPHDLNGSIIFLVTIRDVVNTIFEFLQAPLSSKEYASLTNDEAQTVLKAQRKRVKRSAYYGMYGYGDPLRVDLLGEYVRFEGVRITSFRERSLTFGLDLSRW